MALFIHPEMIHLHSSGAVQIETKATNDPLSEALLKTFMLDLAVVNSASCVGTGGPGTGPGANTQCGCGGNEAGCGITTGPGTGNT